MATVTSNIRAIRGDTIFSPKWFITEQTLPANIEYAEIEQGLEDGIYSLIDLSVYDIRGHIRDAYVAPLVLDLPLDVTDNVLSFELPYEFTEQFDNKAFQLIFDIEFTHKAEDVRITWISGNISITQDVTYD